MATDINGAHIACMARNGAAWFGPAFGLLLAAAHLDNAARARAGMPGAYWQHLRSVHMFDCGAPYNITLT